MRPVIGITCRRVAGAGVDEYRLAVPYIAAVEKAGGIPLLLPALAVRERLPAAVCHGLLFSGGGDPDPRFYGEEELFPLDSVDRRRDAWEIFLVKQARRYAIPVFGICRGYKLLMWRLAALCTRIFRHNSGFPTGRIHRRKKSAPGVGGGRNPSGANNKRKRIWTNSLHHQAVKDRPGLIIAARSGDGVVEALETQKGPFLLAVQWHPERLRSPGTRRLLRTFITYAAARGGFFPASP